MGKGPWSLRNSPSSGSSLSIRGCIWKVLGRGTGHSAARGRTHSSLVRLQNLELGHLEILVKGKIAADESKLVSACRCDSCARSAYLSDKSRAILPAVEIGTEPHLRRLR